MTDTSSLPIAAVLAYNADPGTTQQITVRAEYFEGQIDFKQFRSRHPEYPVLAADPLVLEPVRGSYVVLTKFGSVVFWGCPAELRNEITQKIEAQEQAGPRNLQVEDTTAVFIGKDKDQVTFREIWLRQLTLDHIKIISLALGQSVALERFELEVQAALRQSEPVARMLRTQGRLKLAEGEILKTVGFALEVRSAVLANLTLFDAPPETWESESLSRMDSQLYDHFDLEERHSAVNQKMGYLTDLNSTLMDLLHNRKSQRLEWIIIILIFIEIVFFVFMELLPKKG